jgi:Bacterial toxin 44
MSAPMLGYRLRRYCNPWANNPLSRVDPSGLNWFTDLWQALTGGSGSPTHCLSFYSGNCGLSGNDVGDSNYASLIYPGNDPYQQGQPSGSSGGGGQASTPATPPKNCPSLPVHPANANVQANIATAGLMNPVNGGVNPQSASYINPAATLSWFNNQVKYGAPWDYKTQGSQYEDFGNFNFGATGIAAGFDPQILLRAAGYAQRHHPQSPQFPGNPGNPIQIMLNLPGAVPPYGDDPNDQKMIILGIQYAKNGC